MQYRGSLYVPLLKEYSEKTFGGDFATAADYQDPWLQKQLEAHGWVLWAPVRFGATTINFATQSPFPSPPSSQNWLGTDANGGDVLARILYGTRISILFGLLLTLFSSVLGVLAGAIQGYYGGKIDLWGQRFIEVWSGMPTLFLIILLSSVVQPGFWWLLAITVLFGWMTLVGVVRAEFLRTRNYDYIRAAQRWALTTAASSCAICCPTRWSPPSPSCRYSLQLDYHPDFAGFSRLRPAPGLAFAWRAAAAGEKQPAGAVAGDRRLFVRRGAVNAFNFHW
ncbi:Inner membrane ABC transporter permease protein yejE [Raoultella terrigena]|uniref:Inner membrane ABC transporter permease protein yejE n=1 Tax=Raoultella terrigena TaxID=577 RepID=A0A4U9CX36_RAOTE|nr:Inner membrane ABC transporter permease protein yejE [Raoultella terrigena]